MTSDIHTVVFLKKLCTPEKARIWLKKHNLKPLKRVHKTLSTLRYRIRDPKLFRWFITKKIDDLPPLPALGDVTNNQIVEFNATGENFRGEKISVTQNGGIIEINGLPINFYPWKHLFWIEKKSDVFFLANVTNTNFYIAFLYLTNKSTSFEVKIFDYNSATYQNILYTGNRRCPSRPQNL